MYLLGIYYLVINLGLLHYKNTYITRKSYEIEISYITHSRTEFRVKYLVLFLLFNVTNQIFNIRRCAIIHSVDKNRPKLQGSLPVVI